jgi:hypothetical protein
LWTRVRERGRANLGRTTLGGWDWRGGVWQLRVSLGVCVRVVAQDVHAL